MSLKTLIDAELLNRFLTKVKALIPSKTSELTNDSDFITSSAVPGASNAAPQMDGTASAGSGSTWARGDHIHPSDTSRVPTSRKVNNKALSSDITLTASDVGAVAKTGDTVTGWMNHTNAINLLNSGITQGSVPSGSNYWGPAYLRFEDSSSYPIGGLRPFYYTDGRMGMQLVMGRNVNGSGVENYIRLLLDASGTRTVQVSDAAAWRDAIGAPAASDVVAKADYESAVLTNYSDIRGYNSESNLYTIPADGYIYLSNSSGQSAEGVLYGANANSAYMRFGNSQGRWSQFVKKGMKVYLNGTAQIFRYVRL